MVSTVYPRSDGCYTIPKFTSGLRVQSQGAHTYDCFVSSLAREGAKSTRGVGAGGRKRALAPPTPSSISHLPARDWTRDNRISSSFWSFRTIFSLEYPVWAPCGPVGDYFGAGIISGPVWGSFRGLYSSLLLRCI